MCSHTTAKTVKPLANSTRCEAMLHGAFCLDPMHAEVLDHGGDGHERSAA
jgi:hypothetical protein